MNLSKEELAKAAAAKKAAAPKKTTSKRAYAYCVNRVEVGRPVVTVFIGRESEAKAYVEMHRAEAVINKGFNMIILPLA